ncbi:MAG: BamA/TamA family outer membrane protein [Planctomycetaceae bacterium]|nr:BamA/TamA family outer membrane protein [Planctomycetaceae bacterium]
MSFFPAAGIFEMIIIVSLLFFGLLSLSAQSVSAQYIPNTTTTFDNTTPNTSTTPNNTTTTPNKSNTDSDNVVDVRITGNLKSSANDILKIIKTRKNRPFNTATLEEDKRALMHTGLYVDVIMKVEKIQAGYVVTFLFIERPRIHYIRFVGNHAHTRKALLEEIDIKADGEMDPIAVYQAKERLENFYREGGYHNVFIEILSGDKIGDRGVVFNISEGTQQKVLDVSVEGSKTVSGAHLKTLLQTKRGILWNFGGEFTRKKIDEDVELLINYYRKLGFFYAKVDREFIETENGYTGLGKSRRWVKVKFIIDEGPRCKVRNVKFIGQRSYEEEELRKAMRLTREQYFNQDMLEVDIAKIREKYGEIGYVFASIEPDPRIDNDIVDIVINVKEGPKCYLRGVQVEIIGNEGADPYSKWYTVLNRLSVHPGEVLNTKEIESSKRRIMASGLFNANPMQGQMPEITFSVPENLEEEPEQLPEELVADGPIIRGQNRNLKNLLNSKRQTEPLQRLQNSFPIKTPPQQPYQLPQNNNHQNNKLQSQYQPTQSKIVPLELSLDKFDKSGNKNLHKINTDEFEYRGQYNPTNIPQKTPQLNPAKNTLTPRRTPIQITSTPTSTPSRSTPNTTPSLPPQFQKSEQTYDSSFDDLIFGVGDDGVGVGVGDDGFGVMYELLSPGGGYSSVGDIYLGNNGSSTSADAAISRSPYGVNPNDAYRDKMYESDMHIKVQETRTGMIMMSVAVSSDSGLMGRFMIEEQNFDILNFPKGLRINDWKNAFRGKGQRFRIEAMPGTDVSRYSASWETPYLFNLDYSFGLNGYYYQRFYDEWYETRTGGAVSFGKLWTPDFLTSLSLSAQNVHIYHGLPTPSIYYATGRHPMYGVGINARYNTRDSEYRPTQGHLIAFGVEQVFGDYNFVRGNIDVRKYFMLHERPDRSGRWVLGLRSSLDITESGTPIYERYFGGGYTNLRGFEYRGVSPRYGNVIDGGCVAFYNSAEVIFPITADDMVLGSIFVDTGTVEKSMRKWESEYRVSVGFGLYLTIPMMGPAPIALNFGFPINSDPQDQKQIFAFFMGWQR